MDWEGWRKWSQKVESRFLFLKAQYAKWRRKEGPITPEQEGELWEDGQVQLAFSRAREECFSEAFSEGPPFVSNLTLLDRGG